MTTNDPENPKLTLQLKGEVKKLVSISPGRIIFKGKGSQKLHQTVTIIPGAGVSFNIVDVKALNGSDFIYSLEEVNMFGQKTYQLTVENNKTSRGRYTDKLTFITDRTDYPDFSIMISGDIQ